MAALSVSVHEFPPEAPATIFPERGAYCFWYRPRTEKGDTRVTVPELGLSRHRICRDHVLVFPPLLPVHGQWERAEGRVVRFSFAPRSPFLAPEALCLELGKRSGLAYCYWNWGLLARKQRDRKTEREKLSAALGIFTELNMPRERDAVRAELEKTAAADSVT